MSFSQRLGFCVMRINDRNLTGAAAAEAGRTQKVDRFESGSSRATAGLGGDRVELSGALGNLSKAMASYETGRSNKVHALAAQYQSGNYRPDSAATSRGM